jgi:archaemetzincin
MKLLHLLPIGAVEEKLLLGLKDAIPDSLGFSCEILPVNLDPEPAFHAEREQYLSSEILARMQGLVEARSLRVLGVVSGDLYIPILKYVFGEAQMDGPCAVLSSFRLRQEFYGLPRDEDLLGQRLLKESIHELGHTLGLRHCQDYHCAMASAHSVEWIDLRDASLCPGCRAQMEALENALGRKSLAGNP